MAVLLTEQIDRNDEQQDELVRVLEQHPEYYAIMKSALCIRVLESLSEKAKNFLMLKRDFPRVEHNDLVVLLEMLIEIGVVSYLDAGSSRFYYTNNKGKQFLEIYRETKERFLGKEEEPF